MLYLTRKWPKKMSKYVIFLLFMRFMRMKFSDAWPTLEGTKYLFWTAKKGRNFKYQGKFSVAANHPGARDRYCPPAQKQLLLERPVKSTDS